MSVLCYPPNFAALKHVTNYITAENKLENTSKPRSDALSENPRLQQTQAANPERAPAKRRYRENAEDDVSHTGKRPRYKRGQNSETRIRPDKDGLIESWLEGSSWSRLPETPFEMPRKPAVLPSPDDSTAAASSISRRSAKSVASVHDVDYRESLRYRNIFVEREDAPRELIRRAQRITSRSRTSPEIDDATVEELKRTSRRVQDDAEDKIIKQLIPDIIPSMKRLPDQRLEMSSDQRWFNSVPIPLDSSILATPLPLSQPKPDLAFGYSAAAFTRNQLGTIDLLINDQFGQSYAVPDSLVRFPFLQIEFKSQAKNGTHYIATNQAAGAGAIALNGDLDLMQRSFGLHNFDYEEPRYFSVTIDHQFACVNIHWLRAPTEKGGKHSFHVEGLSQHLLRDAEGIRAVSRAIKNILEYGVDSRLRTLCGALDAYRETVVLATNAQREREHEYGPQPHIEQQGLRTRPAPEVPVGVPASFEEVRTSRQPLAPIRPVQSEQRSKRGAPTPGEVKTGRAPEPVQVSRIEQRPRRVPTTTRRPVQNPTETPARATRLSSKRGSKVLEHD